MIGRGILEPLLELQHRARLRLLLINTQIVKMSHAVFTYILIVWASPPLPMPRAGPDNRSMIFTLQTRRALVEVKQSVKFTVFSKVISTLIKKYITNMISVIILKKKGFVIDFGARVPPSCSTTACDVTGVGSLRWPVILSISLHFEHTNIILTQII